MLPMRTLGLVLTCAVVLLSSCELPSASSALTGYYESTTLQGIAQADGGVDILAKGGFIRLRLRADSAVRDHLFVPPNIGSSHGKLDQRFSGSYLVRGDTLHVTGTGTLIDRPWLIEGDKLETPNLPGHGAAFKIILAKR